MLSNITQRRKVMKIIGKRESKLVHTQSQWTRLV